MALADEQVGYWRNLVEDRIATIEWNRVVEDIQPFLERTEDLALLTKENVVSLLERR